MRSPVSAWLSESLAIAFPVACCSCGAPDADLCVNCAEGLDPRLRGRVLANGVPTWSGLDYSGVVVDAFRALKEEGRTGLARHLAPALRVAYDAVGDDLLVVPVPTSRSAARRRGYRVVDTLVRRAALPLAPLLRVTRPTADQRALGREERRWNIHGSIRAVRADGLRVVVADDVVTTGATLGEAVRALAAGGAEVVAAVTVASTARRYDPDQTRR